MVFLKVFSRNCPKTARQVRSSSYRQLAVFVILLLLVALILGHSTKATTIVPIKVLGNPKCKDVCLLCDYKSLETSSPPTSTVYSDGTLTVTVTVDSAGEYFDWSSNIGVDVVIVKGGPNANVYQYPSESFGDTGLHAPINLSNNNPYGLSHITFCYDEEVANPAIEIEKATNGEDADSAPGPSIAVGDTVAWMYEVVNSGNVALESIVVSDDQLGTLDYATYYISGDIGTDEILGVGETWTYQATGSATLGQYTNIGSATGTYNGTPYTDTDPSHYSGFVPTARLTMSADDTNAVGDTHTFTATLEIDSDGDGTYETKPTGENIDFQITSGPGALSNETTTDSNGVATVDLDSPTAGSTTVTANWSGTVAQVTVNATPDTAEKNWFIPAARLTMSADDTNAVGDTHTFTATLEIDSDGDGTYETKPTGENIDFQITSGPGALSNETTTDSNGVATVDLDSPTAGSTTVTANWSGTVAQVTVNATPDTAEKNWFIPAARLTMSADDTNAVGDTHTFTATLEIDSDGDGTYETKPTGENIDFQITSGPGALSNETTTDSNGVATVDLDSPTAGSTTVTANWSGTVAQVTVNATPDTAEKNWFIPAARLTMSADDTNAVGDTHTFTATLEIDSDGDGTYETKPTGENIDFQITSGPGALSNETTTDSNGVATVDLDSPTAGSTTVTANWSGTVAQVTVNATPDTAEKNWFIPAARLTMSADDTNAVGDTHTFTATLEIDSDGDGTYETKPTGENIDFQITSGPGALSNETTTDSNGVATVDLDSPTAGSTTVTANWSGTVAQVTVNATPDEGIKTWFIPAARLTMSADDTNAVGDTHTFTATLEIDSDGDGTYETKPTGENIDFQITSGPGTLSNETTTDSNGVATVDLDSPTAGSTTVTANWSGTVAQVTVNATPDTAEKNWFIPAARLTMSADDTNAVGDTHTFTATLEIDSDGDGTYETKPTGENIDFRITSGPGALSNETTTDSNGVATVDLDSPTAGSTTVTANWSGTVAQVTVNATPDEGIKTWFIPAARLTMSADDTNAVGDTHTFTATLEIDSDGDGTYETKPTGENIDFQITSGPGTLSNETTTDSNGVATVDLDSPTAGSTTVTANWSGTVAQVTVNATPDTAEKNWFIPAARLTMSADDTNAVGDTHTFTATLEIDSDGDGTYETKPTGENIDFRITSGPGALSNETTTDSNGVATVDLDSPTAGSTTVTANWSGTVAQVTVNATPDEGIKTWFIPAARLTMSADDTNAVGDTHTFTATLEIDSDGDGTYETKPTGENIDFQITSGPGTLSNETTTDSNGVATVDLDSPTAGSTTVTANWSGTVAQVTVNATPDEGIKTWFIPAARLTMSADDTNAVGDTHTFTALLEIDADGNGTYETTPSGEDIDFQITSGPGTLSNETTTDSNGVATVDLDSPTAGSTTVTANWSGTVAQVTVNATPDEGIKTWVDGRIKIGPPSATNVVGDDHTLTTTVEVNDGTGWSASANGTPVTFSITLGAATFVSGNTATTTNGECTIDITSNTPGSNTVRASTNVVVGGLLLHRETDGTAGNSSEATKIYVTTGIDIEKATNGQDADTGTGPYIPVGQTVTWTYIVTNTGDTPILSVIVTDDNGTPGNITDDFNPAFTGGDNNPADGRLDVNEIWSYAVQATAIAGQYVNIGQVTGEDSLGGDLTDSDFSHYFGAKPGIAIVKDGPATVSIGGTITYDITITNTGNVVLHNVLFNDAKLGIVDQDLGDIAVGDSVTIHPTYGPVTENDLPGPIVNTAIADSDEAGPVNDGHSVEIVSTPGIAIVKDGPATVSIGGTITYDITITNTGNVVLHNVLFNDAKLGIVNQNLGDIAVGDSVTIHPTYGPVTENDLPGPIVNTAIADSDEAGPVNDGHSVEIVSTPGIAIVKDGPATVSIGGTITYDITITNTGNVVLHNVLFNDAKLGIVNQNLGDIAVGDSVTIHPTYGPVTENDLPGPIVNTAIASSDEAGPVDDSHSVAIVTNPRIAIVKDGPATVIIGGTITYDIIVSNTGNVVLHNVLFNDAKLGIVNQNLGDIAVGDSVTIHPTYGPVTENDLPGPIVNTAIASSDEAGPVDDSHSVEIVTTPGIAIVKDGPATVSIGGTITYDITVTNTGNVVLHNVLFNDAKLGIVNQNLGDIAVGDSVTIHPTYGPVTENDLPGPIVNTAIADSDEAGPVNDGHSVEIVSTPGIAIVKDGPATVIIGGTITYDITVTNTGNVVLHNVLFNDAKLGIVNQNLGDIAVGDSVTIHPTYGPVTENDLPGPIVNTAIADSDEAGPVNDSHSVDIVTNPDITIEKATNGQDADSAPGPTIAVGDPITWTYVVTNTGSATLTNIAVTDSVLGAIGTITSLAPGASQTLTKTGTAVAGQYANTGTVTVIFGDTTYTDSDDSHYFGAGADLSLTKSVNNADPNEGDTIVYTITLTNGGPSDATGVEVTDALPAGLTYVSDNGAGAYSSATNVWTVSSLTNGASVTLTITATVDTGTAGTTIANTAEVTAADQPDPDSTPNNHDPDEDDQSSVSITVQSADLVVDKTVDNPTPNEGDTIVYTITITNDGPSNATGVTLGDLLPVGVTYVSDNSGGAYDSATGVWTVGSIAVGDIAVLEITATVDAGTAGTTITNTAEVTTSDQPDPDDTNNRDSADITVTEELAGGGGATEDTCEGRVIINEVAWAGTAADSRDEWIELRNLGTIPVDLTGWTLRWRRKQPTTEEEYRWKVVNLSAILLPASTSACELADNDSTPSVEFIKRDTDDLSWWVLGKHEEKDGSYYTMERRHDETISNEKADLIYDTTEPYEMDLTDLGDVIQLINDRGEVVDTANASNPERDGWPAGSAATFATMERTDPLGPDTWENWHTNLGIITRGLDAQEHPLIATADVLNSQALEELALAAHLPPMKTRAGARLEVGLDLPREDRKALGWPWIRVTRPDLAEAAGGGGTVEAGAGFSFSGRYSHDLYWLGIDTSGLSPGQYNIWVVYGEGKAILVPIVVLP